MHLALERWDCQAGGRQGGRGAPSPSRARHTPLLEEAGECRRPAAGNGG